MKSKWQEESGCVSCILHDIFISSLFDSAKMLVFSGYNVGCLFLPINYIQTTYLGLMGITVLNQIIGYREILMCDGR